MANRRRLALIAAGAVLCAALGVVAAGVVASQRHREPIPVVTVAVTHTAIVTPEPSPPEPSPSASAFEVAARSVDDPESPWVVVNKARPVDPIRFVPTGLEQLRVPGSRAMMRQEAADALALMYAAAKGDGAAFLVSSAYRSYAIQDGLYRAYVVQKGRSYADRVSARPGFSEHQTGLAVDVYDPTGCRLVTCYADTASGRWLAEHAAGFGFIVRYPEGKEQVTGYLYEPWHLRYVGTDLAAEMKARSIVTLEELFGLPAAPDYA